MGRKMRTMLDVLSEEKIVIAENMLLTFDQLQAQLDELRERGYQTQAQMVRIEKTLSRNLREIRKFLEK